MKSEIVYGADGTVTAVRHAWAFDDMFSTYALQGVESKKKGEYHARGAEAACGGEYHLAEGIRLLHARAGRRQEGRVRAGDRLLARIQGLGSHAAFHLAGEGAGQGEGGQCRHLRSVLFHRFQLRRKGQGSGEARRHAGRVQAACEQAGRQRDAARQAPLRILLRQSNPDSSNFGAQFANKIAIKCP